jgi:multidrug efflux system membrane fusion protein
MVPEQRAPRDPRAAREGAAAGRRDAARRVEAEGRLDFVDNMVDRDTGTVRLRGTFPNRDEVLWPGQFVRASVTLREQPDAIVVPGEAVQAGRRAATSSS